MPDELNNTLSQEKNLDYLRSIEDDAKQEDSRAAFNKSKRRSNFLKNTLLKNKKGNAVGGVARKAFVRSIVIPFLLPGLIICCICFTLMIVLCSLTGGCASPAGSPNSTLEDQLRSAEAAGCLDSGYTLEVARRCVQFNQYCVPAIPLTPDEKDRIIDNNPNLKFLENVDCSQPFDPDFEWELTSI